MVYFCMAANLGCQYYRDGQCFRHCPNVVEEGDKILCNSTNNCIHRSPDRVCHRYSVDGVCNCATMYKLDPSENTDKMILFLRHLSVIHKQQAEIQDMLKNLIISGNIRG